jgi:hypothetical protein
MGNPFRENGIWKVPTRCDCGTESAVRCDFLIKGQSLACGCRRHDNASSSRHRQRPDVPLGERFGAWVVVGEPYHENGRWRLPVQCDCGSRASVRYRHLCEGTSTNCGCARKSRMALAGRTGGTYRSRIYTVWEGMLRRCREHPAYTRRGITVCPEWTDYNTFYLWAIGSGHHPSLQLDRIDNDSGYRPDNCRWVICAENQRNKISNIFVVAFGERKVLADWERDNRCSVQGRTIKKRIFAGIVPELAITLPPYYERKGIIV